MTVKKLETESDNAAEASIEIQGNMQASKINNKSVAIIGGGQLAMLLADAAIDLGYQPHVLAQSALEPVVLKSAAHVDIAPLTDQAAIGRLLAKVSLLTFESELTPAGTIAAAEAFVRINHLDVDLQPSARVMAVCSDKLQQKRLLQQLEIPTASFDALATQRESADEWLSQLKTKFPTGSVIKWARGGYDGIGTLVYRGSESEQPRARAFIERALATGSDVYAETLVPFAFELAVVSSRSLSSKIAQYPAVITVQKSGVCAEVKGPGTVFGLSTEMERAAFNYAQTIGDSLGMVGTYAVEFFVDQDGRISVNEIAPRVHNSGHFSLDAAETSQFENHWRAILDLPLGSTCTDDFFAMINIIGPAGYDGQVLNEFALSADGMRSYWYGKSASRPGRKLGHVNITATSSAQLSERMEAVKAAVALWQSSLSGEVSHVQK